MFFRKKKVAKTVAGVDFEGGSFSTELLHLVSSNFAITDQVVLSPEYIQDLNVESIIVGFLVNKQVVYAMEDVIWDEATQTIAFHSRDDGKNIAQVERFSLLLPLENSDDREMAYHRKEALSRVGLFKRGNTITVAAQGGGKKSYTIDGIVTSYLRLKDGLFANHEVAVLSLDPRSFKVSERRKHQRISTDIPAVVKAIKSGSSYECRLIDYVEEAARIDVADPEGLGVLVKGKPVSLLLDMNEIDRRYQLEGTIAKVEGNELIVTFRNILKGGTHTPFSKLDGIEIKAMLQKVEQARRK